MSEVIQIPKTNDEVIIKHPGQYLKQIMRARGMNRYHLSERIGLTPGAISNIFYGDRNITYAIAVKLERALDIPAEIWIEKQASFSLQHIRWIVEAQEEQKKNRELAKMVNAPIFSGV